MIYFLRHPETGLVKIGTTEDYHLRLYQLEHEYGDLELLGLMSGGIETESELHERFRYLKATDHHPSREWFRMDNALLEYMRSYATDPVPPVSPRTLHMKEETLKLVRMYAGELQMDTGDNISDNDAIYELFKLYRADLVKKLRDKQRKRTKPKAGNIDAGAGTLDYRRLDDKKRDE